MKHRKGNHTTNTLYLRLNCHSPRPQSLLGSVDLILRCLPSSPLRWTTQAGMPTDALRRCVILCYRNEFFLHAFLKQEDEHYSRQYRDSIRHGGHPPPPFQDLAPIEESLIGGLKRSLFSHKPPAVPPKEHRHPSSSSPSPNVTYTPAQLVNMSAVDRSKALRAARMDPHLQVCAMLSYLTPLSAVHFSSCAVHCSSMHDLYASLSSKPLMHNPPGMILQTITEFGTELP